MSLSRPGLSVPMFLLSDRGVTKLRSSGLNKHNIFPIPRERRERRLRCYRFSQIVLCTSPLSTLRGTSTGVGPSERNELPETSSRSRAAFSCNEPFGRLVELIKARALTSSDFSEASPAGFYSRSPAAHHWSPRRCGVPPNLTESSSQSRVQTTPSVNKWSAASRRSALE